MPSSLLTLAHSPDPDDVFMWWPITGKIDPRPPHNVIEPPVLDTGRFSFRALPADIDVLNRRAIEQGDLDITALSIFAWTKVADRYALTCCGSSFGEGYGPKLVVRTTDRATDLGPASSVLATSPTPEPRSGETAVAGGVSPRRVDGNSASPGGATQPRASDRETTSPQLNVLPPNSLIAIPGTRTTAFLLLTLALKQAGITFRHVEMPFDHILDAVASRKADAGLLIHQSQLTYADLGLTEILDLGAWWLAHTGLPLPLGGNALKRDLEARHGTGGGGTLREITSILDRSIRHALAHRDESTAYAMLFAPEINRAQADRYIDMYVSDLTVDAGPRGLAAMVRLVDEAARAGLCQPPPGFELLRP